MGYKWTSRHTAHLDDRNCGFENGKYSFMHSEAPRFYQKVHLPIIYWINKSIIWATVRIQLNAHTQRHTQQLGDVVEGLTPQEQLPITSRVARETLLAPAFVLLSLHKISGYVVVFRNHSVTWSKRQELWAFNVCARERKHTKNSTKHTIRSSCFISCQVNSPWHGVGYIRSFHPLISGPHVYLQTDAVRCLHWDVTAACRLQWFLSVFLLKIIIMKCTKKERYDIKVM